MTWDASVDEALCFGWIDGLKKTIDAESYKLRFTPRRRQSHWSTKNIRSVRRLIAEGRMAPAGLEAFEAWTAAKSGLASFEQDQEPSFPPELDGPFRANRRAWRHFGLQPAGYRRTVTHWVISAKREDTRRRRLDRLIEVSERGQRVNPGAPFRDPQ